MPVYSTSIQLHNADEKDFLLLDRELKSQLFKAEKEGTVKKVKSSIDNFMNARYYREGNLLIQDVIDRVWSAAKKTGKQFSFSVIKKRS
ncbi:MAG: hypothetical protein KIT80_00070 [Chitinophagaceae bacterium]|nr:hypothetical protein [Chitinophagaceae bacterium]MCW5925285.1 hypothetical protein [Chitinophagaceae bacterium]